MMKAAKTSIKHLTYTDIAVLTLIFFGIAIISSNYAYLMTLMTWMNHHAANEFQAESLPIQGFGNLWAIVYEVVLLGLAFAYLTYRRFDFGGLNFAINRHTPLKIVLYFMVAGTVATLVYYAGYWFDWAYWYNSHTPIYHDLVNDYTANHTHTDHTYQSLSYITPNLIVFALLNGFFEELFFIGLLFATPKTTWRFLLPLSVVIRFSFHTYQGLWAATTIATLGLVFIYFRKKDDELIPFMLTHSLFDVFGLGLPLFLLD